MPDTALSEYLNGMLNRARAQSDRIGRSDVCVFAYFADGWEKAFRRQYRLRALRPVPAEETFFESLAEWFGCSAPELVRAIEDRLGEPVAILRAADEQKLIDKLSSCNGGVGAFYFTEDVFFAAFRTHVLAFLVGNFE